MNRARKMTVADRVWSRNRRRQKRVESTYKIVQSDAGPIDRDCLHACFNFLPVDVL